MDVLSTIPFELDASLLMKRAHVVPGSADASEFERFVNTARAVAQPKAGYREAFIDAKGEATVTLEGLTFTSRMLQQNLEQVERVFPDCHGTRLPQLPGLPAPLLPQPGRRVRRSAVGFDSARVAGPTRIVA